MNKDLKPKQKESLHLYGCGGFGINILQSIVNIQSDTAGFPDTTCTLIDTSMSNLSSKQGVNSGYGTYIIDGVDGSGRNRKYAYDVANTHIDKILLAHPPKSFNVVLFSLGGGTGSVIGPLLVAELIKRGQDVLAICVGSYDNSREAANTKATFATMQHMATNVLSQPIAVMFNDNNERTPRSNVDIRIEHAIRAIALLVSGCNHELDRTDISNWLHYHKVTNVPPQLVDVVIHYDLPDATPLNPEEVKAIAMCSLIPVGSDSVLNLGQLYGALGYLPPVVMEATSKQIPPMHFVITNSFINEMAITVTNAVREFEKLERGLLGTEITVVGGDVKDNLIF